MINSVFHGDALKLLGSIASDSIELVLTDIPYGVVNRESGGLRDFDKGDADVVTFQMERLINEFVRVCRGSIYVWCGTEQVSALRAGFVAADLTTRLCIWEKRNPSPINGEYLWLSSVETCVFARKPNAVFTERCVSPVFRHNAGSSKDHPTQKPLQLFRRLICASTHKNDTVLDPFCGSGTTAVAARLTGRQFIVGDINADYIALTKQRLAETWQETDLIRLTMKESA